MSTVLATPSTLPPASGAKYATVAELLHALGDIPPQRVLMDPLPGTATEEQLLRLVEVDKRLVEMVDGTLVEKPGGFHEGILAAALARVLGNFVRERNLGIVSGPDTTMRTVAGNIRLPDVGFFSWKQLPGGRIPDQAVPTVTPDIAIEILSNTNTKAEMRRKRREYFEGGGRLVWEIDPRTRSADVYEPSAAEPRHLSVADALDGDDVLPGFSLFLKDLFAELDVHE